MSQHYPKKKKIFEYTSDTHTRPTLTRVMLISKSIKDLKRIYYFFNGGHIDLGRLLGNYFVLPGAHRPGGLMTPALLPLHRQSLAVPTVHAMERIARR